MKTRLIVFGFLPLLLTSIPSGCGQKPGEEESAAATEVVVQTGKVVRATLRARVDAYGNVDGEPSGGGKPAGVARLSAPAAGVVIEVLVKEGDRVSPGAVIVRLDDRVALAQVEKARHAVEFAEQQMARQNKLKSVEGTSERLVQDAAQQLAGAQGEVATAQAQLALVQLASPIAGVVTRVHVQPGRAVEPNTIVAEVIDPDRLVANFNVPATQCVGVKTGQRVDLFTRRATAGAQGKVLYVEPQVDPATDSVLVRVSVPAGAGMLSGQFVHGSIITEERADRLAVPLQAVYTDHDGQTTLSLVEGNTATQKIVKTGIRDGELVEVEGEGIKEGAAVVTLGSYALPRQTKIRIQGAGEEK